MATVPLVTRGAVPSGLTRVLSAVGVSAAPVTPSGVGKAQGGKYLATGLSLQDYRPMAPLLGLTTRGFSPSASPAKWYPSSWSDARIAAFVNTHDLLETQRDYVDMRSRGADAYAMDSLRSTAKMAVDAAAAASKPIIVINNSVKGAMSTYDLVLTQLVTEMAEGRVEMEVLPLNEVANRAVLHPEDVGVVVGPPEEYGHLFLSIASGLAGGEGLATFRWSDAAGASVVYEGGSEANPVGTLIALADLLEDSGKGPEAKRVRGAVEKAMEKTKPKDVPSGAADGAQMWEAIASAC